MQTIDNIIAIAMVIVVIANLTGIMALAVAILVRSTLDTWKHFHGNK